MLKITAMNRYYVVDIGDSRIHMLNYKSLVHFLKKQVGLDAAAVSSILSVFDYEATVTVDLNHVTRRVS